MKFHSDIFFLIMAGFTSLAQPHSLASPYPGDYPLFTDCQELSYVKVCRSLQQGGVALDITYGKWHVPTAASTMKAWVRVKYRDGNRDELYTLTRQEVAYRGRITNGCLVGSLGGCAVSGTEAMKHQLYWAVSGMKLNELSLELAFIGPDGIWDSRRGENFRFWFPERAIYD